MATQEVNTLTIEALNQLDFSTIEPKTKSLVITSDILEPGLFAKFAITCYLYGPIGKRTVVDGKRLVDAYKGSNIRFARFVLSMQEKFKDILESQKPDLLIDAREWPSRDEMKEIEKMNKDYWKSQRRR